jgi:uncharacterized protein YkwD
MKPLRTLLLLSLLLLLAPLPARGTADQTAALLYDEARTVYLGNLQRRANGVPPLRWNRQLTDAARWFSWDSTENRPSGFCGHQDTLGGWPGDRALTFGYLGGAGAENAFCGYVTPEYAITGWMNSSGHRANLLDPGSREIGLGYYRRTSDGRGYVTQDFGADAVYAPVVIEDEALNTTAQLVDLYIYNRQSGGGFREFSPASEMMLAKDRCFTGASWEPYQAEKSFNLDPGTGWRSVYVKTRDTLGRTMTVSDTIYLGSDLPLAELGYAQMSSTSDRVTLYNLNGGGLPQVQFSLDWRVDNTFGTFQKWWGNGQVINDAAAWGGTAYRMYDGDGETMSWVYTHDFIRNTPLVAYIRLKVSSNTSTGEVARLSVEGDSAPHQVSLKGTDFSASNQYQEFAIPFMFVTGQDFLTFSFWRSGAPDVVFDALTIFTAPQPISSPYTWVVPGGNYRGQGVWVRYTNGSTQFSAISDAVTSPGGLGLSGAAPVFLAQQGGSPPGSQYIRVLQLGCQPLTWGVSDDRSWITTAVQGDRVAVSVNPAGLAAGSYSGTVTITPSGGGAPLQSAVTLVVAQDLAHQYLGYLQR